MKTPARVIVDLNSTLNAALLGGKDPDGLTAVNESGKAVHVNTALYGVERFFDALLGTMNSLQVTPKDCIGVWDGLGAKMYRQAILPQYKQGRDKLPEVHAQLAKAREMLAPMLRSVGFTVCHVKGREADDVIAHLTQRLRDRPNIVVSGDGDMAALVDENTHIYRNGQMDQNPFGGFPHKYITLYKALVGDGSDNIPGARGFGDAAFVDLVRVFGLDGLDAFQNLIVSGRLRDLKEDVPEFPRLQKVLDSEAMVTASWNVARLYPDSVNTNTHPIEWVPGIALEWDTLDAEVRIPAMKQWYGTKTLVTALNYGAIKKRAAQWVSRTETLSLDIETSSGEESDEWLQQATKRGGSDRIDALGHELTGMSLTFGDNAQHTIYMSVDHAQTENITVDQCREMVEVFAGVPIVAHNRAFEFQVLYRTWADKWKDNGWHGFLPNCRDTMIEASYVDENLPRGLKFRSKQVLGYEQETYEHVTTMEGPLDVILEGGVVLAGPFTKIIEEAVVEDFEVEREDPETGEVTTHRLQREIKPAVTEDGWYRKQYKMRELTARRVLNYGCDDTICTAWLHQHFRTVMLLEDTWDVYLDVEILPQYLTSLAYVQGVKLNLERLMELEREDKATYTENWAVLRDYLFTKGWAGTVKPVFEEVDVAAVKEVCEIVLGEEFTTRKRKLPAVAADLRAAFPDNELAEVIAVAAEQASASTLNALVDQHFTGEPKINFDSPRQVQKLLYGTIGITPRIYNKLTPKERQDDATRGAFKLLRDLNVVQEREAKKAARTASEVAWDKAGGEGPTGPQQQGDDSAPDSEHLRRIKAQITDEMRAIWMKKASTDDQSIELALVKDTLDDEQRKALHAYLKIKEVTTRVKMFYTPYKSVQHWTDGLVHSSMNQCEAITRRYSSTGPNLQQLPSRGEGVKFRTLIEPHHDDAITVSLDFNGQELVLMAEVSGDEALRSCYMGDNLRDGHSLIAVAAAQALWGETITYEQFIAMRKSEVESVALRAAELRGNAKTVNFATQFGAMAPKVAMTLKSTEEVAQEFIDAKDRAFPGINIWKTEQAAINEWRGYALTLLGARRHLNNHSGEHDGNRLERQGINYEIQGSAAEQTKLAMASMWRRGLFTGKYDARFVAPVHDETVSTVHRKDAVKFIREAHECMTQNYAGMVVPMKSSLAIGLDFSCPVEIGTDFTDEQVQAAVDKLFEGRKA